MVRQDCCIGWYDHVRNWTVPPHTIPFSRERDVIPILGNRENSNEYLGFLRVI